MVLLFEPDPVLASLFRFLLEHLGCTARVATTLEEVTQLAGASPPTLAVVHPSGTSNAWAVCRQIHTRLGAPVIGLLPPDVSTEPLADLHILPLPVVPATLRQLVQQLLTIVLR